MASFRDLMRQNRRLLTAGMVGSILEWYDFAVYGYFALTLGKLFFPSDDPATSLIASFGAFAAGYLMRPVGGALFGYIGDLVSRKKVLIISIMMMAVPTFLVGTLPTHADIGLAAAALLVLLRMAQGISVGGEEVGAFVFLVEHAPPERRAFFGCWTYMGAFIGILLGSAVGALITALLSEQQLSDWGWRLPFLSGVVIAFVGLAIRRGIAEPALAGERAASPMVEAVTRSWRVMLQAATLNMMGAVAFYAVFIYIVSWLVSQVGLSHETALDINTISMVVIVVVMLAAALLSDKIGRKPLLLFGSGGTALFAYPLVWLMHHDSYVLVLAGQFGFAVLIGSFFAVIPATMAELFPWRVRVTGAAVSYNLPMAIFGGTAPMVGAWLVHVTDDAMSVAWYVAAVAAISFVVALTMRETQETPLDR
ncbi:MAG: MFS transporter [Pseudomonadota bacterium]